MNGMTNSKEKNWLIKSSTRILGPYSLGEVIEMLRSKQVSIIDEVRQPMGRWSYIRENKVFMDVVKNIRAEDESTSDKTMTMSVAQHTMTKTETTPGAGTDDFTRTPLVGDWEKTPVPGNQQRSNLKDVTPIVNTPVHLTGFPPTNSKAKSYGAAGDSRVKEQIRNKSNLLRLGILGTACAVAVVVMLTWNQKDKRKSVGFDDYVNQAIRYKNLGLYEKSLQAYTKAQKIKEPTLDIQIQMAPVLISEDRQSLVGRRILERAVTQEGRNRTDIVDAYLGIAISYMMDGDLKQAEDILQKAIGYEPFNLSALLNMAIIQQKKGYYQEALKSFEEIYRKNNQSTLALFGRALSAVESSKKRIDPQALHLLIRDIRDNVQKTGYLRQELLLFMVYAYNILGDVNGLNQAVVEFLSEPFGQAKNYIHPLNVDWRFSQWDYLEKFCAEIYSKRSPHPQLKSMRAVCLMEVNRDAEANKLLQEAMAEAPRDPYVLVTQASYLSKMGRSSEAITILKMAELKTLPIKHFLLGDVCKRAQDISCAQQSYTEVYNLDSKSAMGLYGLAWVVMNNKDNKMAYEYVRGGLQAEPNFLPLLELRDKLESQ